MRLLAPSGPADPGPFASVISGLSRPNHRRTKWCDAAMRKLLIAALAFGAAPASARVIASVPRIAGPAAVPFGALARPTLGVPSLSPTATLLPSPSLAPTLSPLAAAPSLLPAPAPSALVAPAALAAPAAADAPSAKGALTAAGAALAAPNADQAAVSRKTFDAGFSAANDAPSFGPRDVPSFRAPDHYENRKIGYAVGLLNQSRTPVGADLYAKAYNDYGARLQVLVDDRPEQRYDAKLYWRDGAPVLSLTRELLSRGSDAAVAALLVRELSHLYYREFPDSTERSWMAHSAMIRTFAEVTGSSRNGWDYANDLSRDGRYVMKAFYDSWRAGLRSGIEPRNSDFFHWLRTGSDSKSGANAHLSLREQRERGIIGFDTWSNMDQYFWNLVHSERDWLNRRF
jgi:hypothetical protein